MPNGDSDQNKLVNYLPSTHIEGYFILGIPVCKSQRLHPSCEFEAQFLLHQNHSCRYRGYQGRYYLANT